jgi:hypothetical protein
MGSPYSPVLTGIGFLQGGKIAPSARSRYLAEVLALMATGNADGRGGSPSTKIFSSIVPLPPIAGPRIPNVITLKSEPLFHFEPDPGATLIAAQLNDPKNNPMWHTIFVDTLLEKTAVALDMPGSTPLFPIFDVSGPFGIDLPIPFALPELAAKLNLLPPELVIKLADLGIKLQPPSLPIPPIPPDLPDLKLPSAQLVLPDLMLGLIKLPFDILLKLVLPPKLDLVLNLPGLPKVVLDLAMEIVIKLLADLGLMLIVPKLFVASLLIYIKNVVAMVCCDIVGALVGTGSIAKSVGTLTGLV